MCVRILQVLVEAWWRNNAVGASGTSARLMLGLWVFWGSLYF